MSLCFSLIYEGAFGCLVDRGFPWILGFHGWLFRGLFGWVKFFVETGWTSIGYDVF